EVPRGACGRFFLPRKDPRGAGRPPVTRMGTGNDIRRQAPRGGGRPPLSVDQRDVRPRGHAIECRIYAEDPDRNFLPSTGRISAFDIPSGPGVRVDAGIAPGSTVSVHYDPMLGKVIVWDHDRPHAIARMLRALGELRVEGVRTTRDVLLKVIDSPEFRAGRLHTRLLEDVLVPRLKGT